MKTPTQGKWQAHSPARRGRNKTSSRRRALIVPMPRGGCWSRQWALGPPAPSCHISKPFPADADQFLACLELCHYDLLAKVLRQSMGACGLLAMQGDSNEQEVSVSSGGSGMAPQPEGTQNQHTDPRERMPESTSDQQPFQMHSNQDPRGPRAFV